ncbi:dCTP deaminase [uncultured Microbacterium sp.]|uniref:dCTP deaminase n=1 Tax=uncultured Microbacterium sp. TaxID=191216 RepID=UPI0035CC1159
MLEVADYLRDSLVDRARAFQRTLEDEIAHAGSTGPGFEHALRVFYHYSEHVITQVEHAHASAPTPSVQLAELRSWTNHFRDRLKFFDAQFLRGRRRVPHSLLDLIESEILRMGIDPTEAVVTVGPPDNFATFVHDLWPVVFSGFSIPVTRPDDLRGKPLALISVPEAEGSRAAWVPVTCGHELGHFLQARKPVQFTGMPSVDRALLGSSTGPLPLRHGEPRVRALEQVLANWQVELTCDAYAVHRYGTGAIMALTDFLCFASPESAAGTSHPPRSLRTRLMLLWLDQTEHGAALGEVEAFRQLAIQETPLPDWAQYLCDHFSDGAEAMWDSVSLWCGAQAYGDRDRVGAVEKVRDLLVEGIPGTETVLVDGNSVEVEAADIVNAVWLAFANKERKSVNKLALKALDTLDFVGKWRAAGGDLEKVQPVEMGEDTKGALTHDALIARLAAQDKSRLVMTPLLPAAIGAASLDLRLGNRFIIFERSSAPAFDAVAADRDPRTMQAEVEKAWGDVFYLHPGQMVLAATLEYIVMPSDLTAQVITRSSYGRLGLLSATAVQVHPHFAGCLTLELVNLGDVPMAITPGERITQLMLWTTTSPVPKPDDGAVKYNYPTGPEFSKIRNDKETRILRAMREGFQRKNI